MIAEVEEESDMCLISDL